MNKFDSLFFRDYISEDDEIREIFHRHFFVIIEDILLWLFFALLVPAFLYAFNVFAIQSGLPIIAVYAYLCILYVIIMYKVFDWYADVWIGTDHHIIAVKWKWFTTNLLFIPYDKIEWIEVRTHSWATSLFQMSDIVIRIHGNTNAILESAESTKKIVTFLQEHSSGHHDDHADGDKEPFNILVDTLSDIVKWHLTTQGRSYITRDYVEKLEQTLQVGVPIDLRTPSEKIVIENWKAKNQKKEESHGDDHDEHEDNHG
jgi:hypothetical protein